MSRQKNEIHALFSRKDMRECKEYLTLRQVSFTVLAVGLRATACCAKTRPTADLTLPVLSEHTVGQLMQMLMLATVVEGRLMGINPYGQPGVEAYKRNMRTLLKASS